VDCPRKENPREGFNLELLEEGWGTGKLASQTMKRGKDVKRSTGSPAVKR